ncbi:MAG: nitroreductase family protein [Pseudomonadales bacterium]
MIEDDVLRFEHLLSTARSVRRNLDFDRPIDARDLYACIDVAVQAPTGLIGEGWRFLVVTDPAKKAAVAELYSDILVELMHERGLPLKPSHQALIDRLHEIPCMIFVCAVGVPPDTVSGQIGFYGSILPAAWSLMLALRGRDIGTTWTSLLSGRSDAVAKILGIPDGVTQTVMLPAAYTLNAVLKPAQRAPAEDVTFWDAWGNPPPVEQVRGDR